MVNCSVLSIKEGEGKLEQDLLQTFYSMGYALTGQMTELVVKKLNFPVVTFLERKESCSWIGQGDSFPFLPILGLWNVLSLPPGTLRLPGSKLNSKKLLS